MVGPISEFLHWSIRGLKQGQMRWRNSQLVLHFVDTGVLSVGSGPEGKTITHEEFEAAKEGSSMYLLFYLYFNFGVCVCVCMCLCVCACHSNCMFTQDACVY